MNHGNGTTSPQLHPAAEGSSQAPAAVTVPIFANPYSGTGPNRKRVDALADQLEKHSLQPRLVWDRHERAELLADPDLKRWCRCVVAAGGDGSVADVINDMSPNGIAPDVPFATLPMGNENLFARQFGFASSPKRIAHAIQRGQTMGIDVGITRSNTHTRLFTLMASAGFDADVVHRLDQWRKQGEHVKRVNRLTYAPKIMSALRKYDYPIVTLEVDGKRYTGAHVFVFNIPQYGGKLGIARHADATDAQLDWIVFQKPGLMNLADYGLSVLRMRHLGRPDVPHGRATSVRIYAESPVPLQADGDPVGFTPVTVDIRPRAVRVIVV